MQKDRNNKTLTPTKLKHWAEAVAFALVLAIAIVQQIANTVIAIQGRREQPFPQLTKSQPTASIK